MGPTAKAQISTNTPLAGYPDIVLGYFTSVNTNLSWTNNTISIATGYKQVTGQPAASTLDLAYYFGSNSRWNIGADLGYDGVGSSFNAYEAQIGYELVQYYDAILEVDLRAGYDDADHVGIVEPVLMGKKKFVNNAFAETGIGVPIKFEGESKTEVEFFVEAGWTF